MSKPRRTDTQAASEAKAATSIMGTVPSRKQKPATPLKAEASERKSAKPVKALKPPVSLPP
jgi:hypothetical protein